MELSLNDIRKVSEKMRDNNKKKALNPNLFKADSFDQLMDYVPKNNERKRQSPQRRRQMEQWR